ncbi:MAG: phosphopantetheine-binding protein [Acidimicrobiales bacterium]
MSDVLTLTNELCSFIDAEVSLDPDCPVQPETDLLTTGLVDSLGAMEIVHWLEETLDIDIDPIDITIDNFQTVDKMIALTSRMS